MAVGPNGAGPARRCGVASPGCARRGAGRVCSSAIGPPLRRLRPPPGREALHARVLALGRRGAADEGTAAWPRRPAARFAEIEAIRRELAGARVSDAERRYAIAVDDVLSDRLYSYDEAVGQAEAAIARARRRLECARPPRAAARAHADVVDAF